MLRTCTRRRLIFASALDVSDAEAANEVFTQSQCRSTVPLDTHPEPDGTHTHGVDTPPGFESIGLASVHCGDEVGAQAGVNGDWLAQMEAVGRALNVNHEHALVAYWQDAPLFYWRLCVQPSPLSSSPPSSADAYRHQTLPPPTAAELASYSKGQTLGQTFAVRPPLSARWFSRTLRK